MLEDFINALLPEPIDWDLLYKKSGNVKCLKCQQWIGPTYQRIAVKKYGDWDGLCPDCRRGE